MDGSAAVKEIKHSDQYHDPDGEAKWVENWKSWDFSWCGRSEFAYLNSLRIEVPASFPDGARADGPTKTVTLKDYWRWSVGLPGEERLLSDQELRDAGLLVEVEGEEYHLFHAPDINRKLNESGDTLDVLRAIISARAGTMPPDALGISQGKSTPSSVLALTGGWFPGSLLKLIGDRVICRIDWCRLFDTDLSGQVLGRLWGVFALFSGATRLAGSTFNDEVCLECATFSGSADFSCARFNGKLDLGAARFVGSANFTKIAFAGQSNFSDAKFGSAADFSDTIFQEAARFDRSCFRQRVCFDRSVFLSDVMFHKAQFQEGASMNRITVVSHRTASGFGAPPLNRVLSGSISSNGELDFANFQQIPT